MDKILACIDGSTYFHSVCDYAAWAAKRTSATVELLHVLGRREVSSVPPAVKDLSGNLEANEEGALLRELAEYDAERAKLTQRRGRLLLDQAKERVAAAGVPTETRLRNGGLVESVIEFETGARLVVIGKRGEASNYASGHLGSNLERIVRSSHRPVLVASRAFRPIERFLIAYDGGPSATRAVTLAANDPLLRGLDCHVLTVGAGDAAARAQLDAAAASLREAGLRVQASLEPGHAEDAISAYVERHAIDCLVMGAYGHSRIRNLIIGSTTTAMVRAARVPVLMVR